MLKRKNRVRIRSIVQNVITVQIYSKFSIILLASLSLWKKKDILFTLKPKLTLPSPLVLKTLHIPSIIRKTLLWSQKRDQVVRSLSEARITTACLNLQKLHACKKSSIVADVRIKRPTAADTNIKTIWHNWGNKGSEKNRKWKSTSQLSHLLVKLFSLILKKSSKMQACRPR